MWIRVSTFNLSPSIHSFNKVFLLLPQKPDKLASQYFSRLLSALTPPWSLFRCFRLRQPKSRHSPPELPVSYTPDYLYSRLVTMDMCYCANYYVCARPMQEEEEED